MADEPRDGPLAHPPRGVQVQPARMACQIGAAAGKMRPLAMSARGLALTTRLQPERGPPPMRE